MCHYKELAIKCTGTKSRLTSAVKKILDIVIVGPPHLHT